MPKEVIEQASARSSRSRRCFRNCATVPECDGGEAQGNSLPCNPQEKATGYGHKGMAGGLRAEFRQLGYSDKDIADKIDRGKRSSPEKYSQQPSARRCCIRARACFELRGKRIQPERAGASDRSAFPTAFRVEELEQAATRS